jgi:pimeloyl-ACP methyl ester carboxylesterase
VTIGTFNGVELYHESAGTGDPVVLVHGSWGDATGWMFMVPALAEAYQVVTYDRRGHSRSEQPGDGLREDDVDDLAALIEGLGLAPAHVVGNSMGASIALRLAAKRPELVRSLHAHEPPLFALLAGGPHEAHLEELGRLVGAVVELLAAGDDAAGAKLFMETVAFDPGAWDAFPPEVQQINVTNAHTFLDESKDAGLLGIDLDSLAAYTGLCLLTSGGDTKPFYVPVVDMIASAIPQAERAVMPGTGHVPQVTHPELLVSTLRPFLDKA